MLRRLLGMGIGEVADRSRQEASKWLERQGMRGLFGPELRARRVHFPNGDPASAPERLFGHFLATGGRRFFAGPLHASTPALFTRLGRQAHDLTVASAESISLGLFALLGYQGLSFGAPVDWRLDPVSGRRSPLVHWSLRDPTDALSVGDSKVVWELSRQQFLVTLGIAYRTTGAERYAEAFAGLVRAWMRANPEWMAITSERLARSTTLERSGPPGSLGRCRKPSSL